MASHRTNRVKLGAAPNRWLTLLEANMTYDPRLLFNEISRRLSEKPFTSLQDLSSQLRVAPRTIEKAILRGTGSTFRKFQSQLLLRRVKSLMLGLPASSVKELAHQAGYSSPRSFGRAVKRACGLTPVELRSVLAQKSNVPD